MSLAALPTPTFTGADLSARTNAVLLEARAARRFATVALMLADAAMAYGTGARPVAAADVIEAGGHRYQVAVLGAADAHLATAGGVLLHLLRGPDGAYNFGAMNPAATGLSSGDDYPKLEKLLTYGHAANGQGPTIVFPTASYYFGQTIELNRATVLRGAGSGLPQETGATATLVFPTDTNGIVVNRKNTRAGGTITPNQTAGDGSIIEGLNLVSTMGTDRTKRGIWLRARAVVRNVAISGFSGDGISVIADTGSGDPAKEGNANGFLIDTIRIANCGRHGLYIDGADANAGTARAVNVASCGRVGIYDSSFLGNTHEGHQVAFCGLASRGANTASQSALVTYGGTRYYAAFGATEAQLVATVPGTNEAVWATHSAGGTGTGIPTWVAAQPEGTYFWGAAFAADSNNARNLFLGMYTESGQPPAFATFPSIVIGGHHGVSVLGGAATWISSTLSTQLLNASGAMIGSAVTDVGDMMEVYNSGSTSSGRGSAIKFSVGLPGTTRVPTGRLQAHLSNGSATSRTSVAIEAYDRATSAYHPMMYWRGNANDIIPGLDNAMDLGDAAFRFVNAFSRQFRPGDGGPIWTAGAGSPEGVLAAPVGSLYARTDGDAGTSRYLKVSGTGTTGWVAMTPASAPATRNAQTGSAYTLALGDQGARVSTDNPAANTVTIPANASVAFPVGTEIAVLQIGAGPTTITGAAGVTVNGVAGGSVAVGAQWAGKVLLKTAADAWVVS